MANLDVPMIEIGCTVCGAQMTRMDGSVALCDTCTPDIPISASAVYWRPVEIDGVMYAEISADPFR